MFETDVMFTRDPLGFPNPNVYMCFSVYFKFERNKALFVQHIYYKKYNITKQSNKNLRKMAYVRVFLHAKSNITMLIRMFIMVLHSSLDAALTCCANTQPPGILCSVVGAGEAGSWLDGVVGMLPEGHARRLSLAQQPVFMLGSGQHV